MAAKGTALVRSWLVGAWSSGSIDLPILRNQEWISKLPLLGLIVILAHPTIASVYGSRAAVIFGLVAVAMMLPEVRRIYVVPFLSIMATSLLLCILDTSPRPLLMAFVAYAVFSLLISRPREAANTLVAALLLAFVWGQAQFFMPTDSLVNWHATVISPHLYHYRPTTFFPAQIYYNQYLLLLVAVFVVTSERRWWVMALWGGAAASAGSTGGVFCAVLALCLWHEHRGYIMTLAFLATSTAHAVFFNDWWSYNYSWDDFWASVFSERLAADPALDNLQSDATVEGSGAGLREPPTILEGIVQFTALAGLLTAVMAVIPRARNPQQLFKLAVGALALVVVVGIQPIMGSLYFSLHLGTLAAIIWLALEETRVSAPDH